MEFIGKFDRCLLLGDTKNIAFMRMEAHEPILLPLAAASRSCWSFFFFITL